MHKHIHTHKKPTNINPGETLGIFETILPRGSMSKNSTPERPYTANPNQDHHVSPISWLHLAFHGSTGDGDGVPHLSLNREGRWGTTDNFTTSFFQFFSVLHCPLGLGDLQAFPFPVLSLHLFFCLLLCLLPPFTVSCKYRWFWSDLMNGRHVHTTAACTSLPRSGDQEDSLYDDE